MYKSFCFCLFGCFVFVVVVVVLLLLLLLFPFLFSFIFQNTDGQLINWMFAAHCSLYIFYILFVCLLLVYLFVCGCVQT